MSVSKFAPRRRSTLIGGLLVGLGLVLLPIVLVLLGGEFFVGLVIDIIVLCVFAMGYNLLFGHMGLLSFGHAAFYGIGAYVVALTLAGSAWFIPSTDSFLVALGAGVVVATVFAAVIGYLCVQRGDIYFAMLTIAFNMMLYQVSIEWNELTGGTDGIIVEASEVNLLITSISIQNNVEYYYFTLAFLLLTIGALWRIQHSSYGELLAIIRENPGRAQSIGINVTFYQWSAFVLSGLFGGLAGGLISARNFVVTPGLLHWTTSAEPVMVSLLGGFSTFFGPIAGAIAYVLIEQFTTTVTQYWQLGLGLVLLVIVLFIPEGLLGAIQGRGKSIPAPVTRVRDRYANFRSDDKDPKT